MSKNTTSHYISISPSDEDQVGPHSRLADVISEILRSRSEGCAIGLLGKWGSGKSTVVRLLEKAIAAKKGGHDLRLFVYDAWIHQGDPLRRSFLEELIRTVSPGVYSGDEQRIATSSVRLRPQVVTSKQTPILTSWGYAIGAALFLTPIGHSMWPEFLYWDTWTDTLTNLTAFLLTSLPLWVFLLALIVRAFAKSSNRSDHSLAGALFFNAHSYEQTVVTEQSDHTTIEFRNAFEEIMKRCETANIRVVIVIDNIDRLSEVDAQNIWSTLQTFFAAYSGINHNLAKNYFLIVPFAKKAQQSNRLTLDGTIQTTENDNQFSDLVAKSFEITLDVPPLLLTGWRDFLLKLLDRAFPDHSKEEKEKIIELFGASPRSTPEATPRQLKQFVNGIVSLHRQRGDEMPLSTYAAFQFHREEISLSPFSLALGKPLTDAQVDLLQNAAWQSHMAALHYGVDPTTATQILLEDRIRKSIQESKADALKAIATVPGFSEILWSVLQMESRSWAPHQGANCVAVILAIKDLDLNNYARSRIWPLIAGTIKDIKRWGNATPYLADSFQLLHNRVAATSHASLEADMRAALEQYEPSDFVDLEDSKVEASGWAQAAITIVEMGSGKIPIATPANYGLHFRILCAFAENDAHWLARKSLDLRNAPPEFDATLTALLDEPVIYRKIHRLTELQIFDRSFWTPYPDRIAARLKTNDRLDPEKAAELSDLIFAIRIRVPEISNGAVKDLTINGFFAHFIHESRAIPGICARLIKVLIATNPNFRQDTVVWNSGKGFDLALEVAAGNSSFNDALANELYRFDYFTEFLLICLQYQNLWPLTVQLLNRIRFGSAVELPPDAILSSIDFFRENDGSFKTAMLAGESFENLCDVLTQRGFGIEEMGLYRRLLMISNKKHDGLEKIITEGIEALSESGWREIFASAEKLSDVVHAITELEARKYHIALGATAATELESIFDETLRSGWPNIKADYLAHLFTALRAEHQKNVADRALDRIIAASDLHQVAQGLRFIREVFADTYLWELEADKVLRSVLIKLIDSGEEKYIDLALDMLSFKPTIWISSASHTKTVFVERAAKNSALQEHHRDRLKTILGIQFPGA